MLCNRLWAVGTLSLALLLSEAAGFAAGIRGGGGGAGGRGYGGGAVRAPSGVAPRPNMPAAHQFNRPAAPVPSRSSVPSFQPRPTPPRPEVARPAAASRPTPGNFRPGDGSRPTAPGGAARPSPQKLEDFLGMQGKPLDIRAPTPRPSPGEKIKPGPYPGPTPGPGPKPGPGPRPDGLRPSPRPDGVVKPVPRPHWQDLKPDQISGIANRWDKAVQTKGFHDWIGDHPNRWETWQGWGNSVHNHWNNIHVRNDWFRPAWWDNHVRPTPWWHYHHWWNGYPWHYWWRTPVWTNVVAWYQPWGWTQPCFYDYGPGGNVVYQDNSVYISGQQVASAEDFAKTAAELATVEMPEQPDQAQVQRTEWLPLGTFALSTSKEDTSPNFVVQLAVNKQGILSGTFFNRSTDAAFPVQGRVDRQTQRVAFTVGDKNDVVLETGLFNLTQEQTPVLVHHGTGEVETYLLVRLAQPEDVEPGETAASAPGN